MIKLKSFFHWTRKNKLGTFSLFLIVFFILLATLGYLITPDSTPYANRMDLQLGMKKPGFKIEMFQLKDDSHSQNIFSKMLFGDATSEIQFPVKAYLLSDSGLALQKYLNYDEEIIENKFYSFKELNSTKMNFKVQDFIQTKHFYFGTDNYGRDVLSRMIIGARVSLSVGFISVFISICIGLSLGALAGYYRGKTDIGISWFINVVWSMPTLLLVIAISFSLGKGFWQVFIAIGLSTWVDVARLVRGQILGIREMQYVEAARALGYSDFRIITKHILPNISGPLLVIASSNFASAILLEAGLSFLGYGAQAPMPSWGSMIKENYGYIIIDSAYLAIIPGIAIMLVVFAFNMLSDALNEK